MLILLISITIFVLILLFDVKILEILFPMTHSNCNLIPDEKPILTSFRFIWSCIYFVEVLIIVFMI